MDNNQKTNYINYIFNSYSFEFADNFKTNFSFKLVKF